MEVSSGNDLSHIFDVRRTVCLVTAGEFNIGKI